MNAIRNTCKRLPQRLTLFGGAGTVAALSLFALVFTQCAASGNRSGEFDPLGFPGDDEVVTRNVAAAPVAVDTTAKDDSELWRARAQADTLTVYRVQFYATNNLAEAEDVLRRARATLPDSLSINFETPYYKLKAGPFNNRTDAEKLVTRLRAMGYEAAWVVEDRIVRPRRNR